MSSISQTTRRADMRQRWLLAGGFTAAVLVMALSPFRDVVLRVAAQGQLHAPNFGLLARLPLAIQVHLATALAALVLGGVLMAVRKGRTFHRVAGWVWVCLVATTAGATLFITTLRPGHFSVLHLFTGWTLIVLPLGVMWAKRHDVQKHRRNMMGLFYGAFAINLIFALIPGRTLWTVFFG